MFVIVCVQHEPTYESFGGSVKKIRKTMLLIDQNGTDKYC